MYQTGTKAGLRRLPVRTTNEFWTFAEESAKMTPKHSRFIGVNARL